jgi:hypothetical protein
MDLVVDLLAALLGVEVLDRFQQTMKEKTDAILGRQAAIRRDGISTADAVREL